MRRIYHRLLSWYHQKADALGKKFGFDARYYISGNFWLTLQQGVAAIGGLAVTVVFARVLDPEMFGAYKYILSLAGIAGVFSLTGMNTALTRAVARGEEDVFVPAVRAFALWSIPSALVLLSMSGYYGYMGNYTYMWALGIASFLQPLWHTGMLYVPYLQGKRDFRASTIYQMIEALSVAALSVAAALYAANILLLVGIFLGGHALFATVWLYKNMCAESRVKNKKHVREMLRYAKHLSGMKVWSSGIQHIDKIIVFQLLGPTALATYAIALAIPAQIRTLLQNTSRLVLPKFSKHPSIAHTTRTFIHKIPHVTFLLLLITTVYTLIASPLYTILFPTYPDAILLSQIYAISFLALPNILFGRTLAAHACVRHMYIQNIATGIITILCITIGGITFDIIGIISGRVLAFFILGTLSVTLTKHAVKQSATHQNQNV